MDGLIPVVNKLQDVFGAIGQAPIDLPQIVVIGEQSSGKSSVLENIVGRDFLPRGTGIVTRRPLVLQLHNINYNPPEFGEKSAQLMPTSSTAQSVRDEWGEFLHLPGQKFYDFAEIRAEIIRETERVSGRNKGISPQSMTLRIFSPRVLNLTLVDLPGITKVSVGDQPEDIEEQTRNMCLHYIRNPNAIILAVSSAQNDVANSYALKLARDADRDGMRTIGVLTKVDIMDPGTDVSEVLLNRVIPLKCGYIAVMNRGQQDVMDNTPIPDGLRRELHFFQEHPRYRHMLDKCGTSTLSRALNQILMVHIRNTLPDIKNKIMRMLSDINQELMALGESADAQSTASLSGVLLRLVSNYTQNFDNGIEGKSGTYGGLHMTELFGGARIHFIFKDVFGRSLLEMSPFDDVSDDDIRTVISNSMGPRRALFVPEISFDILVRQQIQRLEHAGLQCVDLVFEELQRIAAQCETTELERFPQLRTRISEVVNNLLRKCMNPTQGMISNLIKIELSYINTSHPDFISGAQAVAQLHRRFQESQNPNPNPNPNPIPSPTNLNPNPNPNPKQSDPSATAVPDSTPPARQPSPTPTVPDPSQPSQLAPLTLFSRILGPVTQTFTYAQTETPTPRASQPPGMQSQQTPIHNSSLSNIVRLPQVPERMRTASNPSDRERVETEIIKSLISSYFNIVRKNFMDLVPKTIMFFLVNSAKEQMRNELVSELYKEELLVDLMREEEDIASRRRNCREMKELLTRALEIVNEVRDFNTFK